MKVVVDSIGFAVEMMDVIAFSGDVPPFFLPLQELLGRFGFEQADRCFGRRGVLKSEMRNGHELAQAFASSEDTVPGWTSFQLSVNV